MAKMKVYRGAPGGQVTIEDGGKVMVLQPIQNMGFSWGNGGPQASHLAKALVQHVLGDDLEATKIYQRMKFRTVASWTKDANWTITERELMAHIDDIREVEKSTAIQRTMVNQQPAPVVYEGGTGVGGIPFKRSDKDGGPGPQVPPERRAEAVQEPPTVVVRDGPPATIIRHASSLAVMDDWPEKVDGFRRTTGDFLVGTRLVYCLVMCGCYSWGDAAEVSEERLSALPEWSDGMMAEMLDALAKRGIAYAAREKRQEILKSALAKLSLEEREALGLK